MLIVLNLLELAKYIILLENLMLNFEIIIRFKVNVRNTAIYENRQFLIALKVKKVSIEDF